MISSVSGVHFGNNAIDLAAPGKFSQNPAAKTDAPADEFVGKKKSKAPGVIGGIAALLVGAAVTLGILSHKGKLDKAPEFLKKSGEWIAEKAQNVVNWAKGLFGGKKAEAVAEAAEEAAEAVAK